MDSAPLTIACMGEKGPRLEARFKVLDSQGENESGSSNYFCVTRLGQAERAKLKTRLPLIYQPTPHRLASVLVGRVCDSSKGAFRGPTEALFLLPSRE